MISSVLTSFNISNTGIMMKLHHSLYLIYHGSIDWAVYIFIIQYLQHLQAIHLKEQGST
jgi:hypothetical protein